MKDMLFSINSWIYGKTGIQDIAKYARQAGVDGLDISGEPDTTDLAEVKEALLKNNLKAFCINGNFVAEDRVLCHGDAAMRKKAVEYGKKCVDMAVELGAGKVLFVPSKVNGTNYYVSKETDWKHSVESLREIAEYAKTKKDITIVLECVNKYEVTLVRTLKDGIRMAREIGLENVKIIGDTFHMCLEEEKGIHNAIREAGDWLAHLHMGDNTREVPGIGCINWREVMIALDSINYAGALSFEPLPHRLTVEEIFDGALDPETLTAEIKASADFLKSIIKSIT